MARWRSRACALAVTVLMTAVALPACGDDDDAADPDDATAPENIWLEGPLVNIAHAGGIYEAPQNTLHALETAPARGADAIEMDLHMTADGHVVVIHDSTVDRTTDGTGCVVAHTLEEIQQLDAAHTHVPGQDPEDGLPDDRYPYRGVATGEAPAPEGAVPSDFTVPTLAEVFEALPDAPMVLEMKPIQMDERDDVVHDCPALVEALDPDERPDLPAELARLIDEHGMADRMLVASFVDELLHRFAELAPDVDTSFPEEEGFALFEAWQAGEDSENPYGHRTVQAPIDIALELGDEVVTDFVAYLHERGIAAHVWTVNDEATMRRALGWGVDGIITDRVEALAQLLGERAG